MSTVASKTNDAQAGMPLRLIESPTATELEEMQLILHDLQQASRAMKLWAKNYAPKEGEMDDETQLIFISMARDAIVQFVGCFDSTAKIKLSAAEVFAHIENGVSFFNSLKDIRDSYAAHRFGPMRQCVAGIIAADDGKIVGAGHLMQQGFPMDGEHVGPFLIMIREAGKFTAKRCSELADKLKAEASTLTAEALLALPVARTTAPSSEQIRMSREKFRSKTQPK